MNRPIDEDEEFGVTDAIDTRILMHRDAHFGGKFEFMLEYYNQGGKGVNPEFEIERIYELAEMEKRMGQNLAAMMLSGADAEKIARSKEAYKSFKDLYESKKSGSELPKLIADLILSEEEDPEKEIEAVVQKKGAIVPLLIDLLRSSDFSDNLFPGYGYAPSLAVKCLGQIGDKKAIISLFEAIGEGDFFNEDLILDSLKQIGEPAKEFLLKVLHGRPLNIDNERAAIALERFKDDEKVGKACLEMLHQPDVKRDIPLSTFLVLACEGLHSEEDRKSFLSLSTDPNLSKSLQLDMKTIANSWSLKA